MSIATRLGLGFGVLILLIFAFGLLVLYQLVDLKKQSDTLYRHPFNVSRAVNAVEIEILKIHRAMKDVAHATELDQARSFQSRMSTLDEDALHHLEMVKSRFLGDLQIVDQVQQLLIDWRPIRDEVIRLRLAGDMVAADAITREAGARHIALIEHELERLKLFADRKASESLANAELITRNSIKIIGIVLAAAVLLGISITVPVTRSIRIPLARLDRAAEKVSQGDLGQHVVVHSQDELGRLTSTFNSMAANIQEQTEEIQRKNEENEHLLLNILPRPIADRLKQGEEPIADYFPEVTVLFADFVGFTAMSDSASPEELVTLLNHIFTAFDNSAHRFGIEKIKTIGDAYMAVAGLTIELEDPPAAMVEMALDMQRSIDQINAKNGTSFQIRIGINCRPVVAGVIGKSKFNYDLWGDTVNIASRMESHGVAGCVHVSEAVYERVRERFNAKPRGKIDVRGKGQMPTYLISNHNDTLKRLST